MYINEGIRSFADGRKVKILTKMIVMCVCEISNEIFIIKLLQLDQTIGFDTRKEETLL